MDFNGNVGIGTTSPLAPLDIRAKKGNILATSLSSLTSNASVRITGIAETADALCIGMLSTDQVSDNGNNPYAYIQNIWDSAPTIGSALLLNPAGGNVGIGMTNPSYTLDVAGSFNAPSGNGNFTVSFEVGGSTLLYSSQIHKYFVVSDMVFWYNQVVVQSLSGAGTIYHTIPVGIRPTTTSGIHVGYWHTDNDRYKLHEMYCNAGTTIILQFEGAINNMIRLDENYTIAAGDKITMFGFWKKA